MLTIFFDYRGVMHYEFLPTAQTVNKKYYLSVMRHLCEAIRKRGTGIMGQQLLDFAPRQCTVAHCPDSSLVFPRIHLI